MFDKSKIAVGAKKGAPRIVLIGVEGVGKTTAGAQCEAPIFLTAEDGLVGNGFDDVGHYTPSDWPSVLGFLAYVRDEDHGYKSLVIDTVDWLEPILYAYVCARDKKKDIEDYGWAKGYVAAADEFRKALAILDSIHKRGMLIMINAHCKIKTVNNLTGDNYDRYEPKCNNHISGMIKEWADIVLFATYEIYAIKERGQSKAKGVGGQVRVVYTEHSAIWDAKNRFGMPDKMPFNMSEILEFIEKGGSPETVIAKINELVPKLNVEKQKATADFIAKHAANVLRLSEMLNRIRALTQEEGE
jgi:hypothetical protein